MRIFGCLVCIHVSNNKRNKLEPSRKKGIFVGYSESSKAYMIYIQSNGELRSGGMSLVEKVAYWNSKEVSIDSYDEVTSMRLRKKNARVIQNVLKS